VPLREWLREQEDADRSVPGEPVRRPIAGGPVRQRGARPCDGQRRRQRGDLEHLTQHVRTDVAQLAAPVSAEQAKVPCEGTPVSVSEKHTLNGNGIMVIAPVLRRAERIVQLAPHPGS
jgi:hypothetical protein